MSLLVLFGDEMLSYIKLFVLACGLALLGSSSVLAESSPSLSGDDEDEMSKLMAVLEKHTAIATKTKINSDYVPGIVTVLYREEL